MNDIQTVFALFFAVFLGTIANVQPRWKAFNWPLLSLMPYGHRGFIWHRLLLSVAFFNVAPILFFALALYTLKGDSVCTNHTVSSLVFHGIVPAFAAFSFYRLWLSVVEFHPNAFYCEQQT